MADFGAELADMTDAALQQLYDALGQQAGELYAQRANIIREQASRRIAIRKLLRWYDPDQADHDEYLEEMSIGGQPYKPL